MRLVFLLFLVMEMKPSLNAYPSEVFNFDYKRPAKRAPVLGSTARSPAAILGPTGIFVKNVDPGLSVT